MTDVAGVPVPTMPCPAKAAHGPMRVVMVLKESVLFGTIPVGVLLQCDRCKHIAAPKLDLRRKPKEQGGDFECVLVQP